MRPRPHPFSSVFVRLLSLAAAWIAFITPTRAQPAEPEGPVVMLAPMMVEERNVPLKWRYFARPGLEVLAACDDAIAADIVERIQELDELMPAIVPTRFLASSAVPQALILVDDKVDQAQAREVLAGAMQKAGASIRFLPNLRLVDADSSAVYARVTGSSSSQFAYAEERIASLLERHVPRLPDWFVEGVRDFYRQVRFAGGKIEVGPVRWISPEETRALGRDPDRPRVFLPMAELFTRQGGEGGAARESPDQWRAQAGLFVRWALLANNGAAKEALWKYVDRLEQDAASEALFREYFGLGYSDLRNELSDYLVSAIREPAPIVVTPANNGRLPRPRFRPAAGLEVARLRGDWERLEIAYVRANSPALADKYVAQARRTLHRAYDQNERDPRLLASMGLMELDAGNPEAARPLLEAAVTAKVVRPNAYFELARLRLGAIEKEIGPKGKMNAAQVADVLVPLFEGQRQDPPLLENYALMTEVVGRGDAPPTAVQLAALREGALKFAHVSAFVARVIALHVANGQPDAANALAEVGRRSARPPATRRAAADQAAPP